LNIKDNEGRPFTRRCVLVSHNVSGGATKVYVSGQCPREAGGGGFF